MNIDRITPYKFCNTSAAIPDNTTTRLLDRISSGKELSRDEKNQLAESLENNSFGRSVYRCMGWQWSYSGAAGFRRILVRFRHDGNTFRQYYAPDKTSLRYALVEPIAEMIYV